MRIKSLLATIIAFMLPFCLMINVFTANAGASKTYAISEYSVTDGSINQGNMIVVGGVRAEGSEVIFDENCADVSKLIAKTKINNMKKYGIKTMINASMSLEAKSFENLGKITLCFGLNSLQSGSGSKDSFEVEITGNSEDNVVKIGVNEYVNKDTKCVIKESSSFHTISYNQKFLLKVFVDVEGVVSVYVNEKLIVDSYELITDPTGYISLISYGKNNFIASKINIFGYKYDLPENINYTETFENGYNANVFYSESVISPMSPSTLSVQEGKLRFKNASGASFMTKYKYSNFQLDFDLMDLQREVKYDSQNNVDSFISSWFSIVYGVDNFRQPALFSESYESFLLVEGMSYSADKTIPSQKPPNNPRYIPFINGIPQDDGIKEMKYNFWDSSKYDDDTIFNVRFVYKDGVMQFFAKLMEDADFDEPLYQLDIGFTETGSVGFFCCTETSVPSMGFNYINACNFSIDNLSIKNLDFNPDIMENPEFKSNIVAKTPDYEYKTITDDSDILMNKINNNGGCNSNINSSGYVLFFLSVSVIFIICLLKRRNTK